MGHLENTHDVVWQGTLSTSYVPLYQDNVYTICTRKLTEKCALLWRYCSDVVKHRDRNLFEGSSGKCYTHKEVYG